MRRRRASLSPFVLALAALSCSGEGPSAGAPEAAPEAAVTPAARPSADSGESAAPRSLAELPEACALVGGEEVARFLGVQPSELATEGRHRPRDWASSCSWRVGAGLRVRAVDLSIRASYTRGDYRAGGNDLSTEDYARRLLSEGGSLVAYDPELAAGSYLFETDAGYLLHVDTPLALADVPEPLPHEPAAADKLVVQITAWGHDGRPGTREAVLQLGSRVIEEMEDGE